MPSMFFVSNTADLGSKIQAFWHWSCPILFWQDLPKQEGSLDDNNVVASMIHLAWLSWTDPWDRWYDKNDCMGHEDLCWSPLPCRQRSSACEKHKKWYSFLRQRFSYSFGLPCWPLVTDLLTDLFELWNRPFNNQNNLAIQSSSNTIVTHPIICCSPS